MKNLPLNSKECDAKLSFYMDEAWTADGIIHSTSLSAADTEAVRLSFGGFSDRLPVYKTVGPHLRSRSESCASYLTYSFSF
jgi:hypothetical protein